jgi:uncharacterized membrane protein YeaQ/YmgE (transglycosylase-associated protein family)
MNLFAWIAFGAISGFTAIHLSPVDDSIGEAGQALIAIAGSIAGGLLATLLFGTDPMAARIDLLAVSIGVVGSIVAVVGREEVHRGRLAPVAVRERIGRR